MTGSDPDVDPEPLFDTVHPRGAVMFRSCRGGYLHSVVLGESALDADADTLAAAILLTASVSHLKAVMQVRREIIDAGLDPSEQLGAPGDLEAAENALAQHWSPS